MDDLREAAREFFRRGLEQTGWTAYRWAKEAGVASTTITRLLNDPDWKNVPKAATLQKLAAAARLELPDILNATATMDLAPVGRSIPVVGDVRAGSWERIPEEPAVTEWLPMSVPEYAGAALFALRVSGRSMDLIYPDGTYVICAPPSETGLQEGDCVVVRRSDSSGRAETTLKQIERQASGFVLMPRSTDPDHQDAIPIPRQDEMAQSGVEIIGVVISDYNKSRRGRGPLITL